MTKLAQVKLENFQQYTPQGQCSICDKSNIPVVIAGLPDKAAAVCKDCAQAIVTLHNNMAIMFGSETVE